MIADKDQKKELNRLLHKLVRARDGEYCLRCGASTYLQLSHIYPKGKHRKMEFEPENVKLLCRGCHLYWWHKSPIEAWRWLETVLPKDRIKRLDFRANTVDKSRFDFRLHKLFLESEIKRFSYGKN